MLHYIERRATMSEKLEYIAIHTSFDPQVDEILFAGQSQTDPLHYMGPLIHSHYIVHYVISGKGSVTMRGVTYQLSEGDSFFIRSEEHTSELQSRENLVCRLLLEKKK